MGAPFSVCCFQGSQLRMQFARFEDPMMLFGRETVTRVAFRYSPRVHRRRKEYCGFAGQSTNVMSKENGG